MKRALLVKELRESAGLALVSALAIAWALASLTGWTASGPNDGFRLNYIPFATLDFLGCFACIVGPLAALLGLKQTAWEDMRGTFHYLLHRPLARTRVVALKLAVGLTLVLLAGAALIVLHAIWARRPGNHSSPFYWSMTAEAWQAWIVLPVIYLAAFLSGLRPARWIGSRLAPLVVGAAAAIGLGVQPWWWIAVVGSALLSGVLAACIFSTATTRDY